MKKSFLLFIFIYSFCKLTLTFGQSYSFKSYSIAEGLSQTQVKAITEDKDGYLWLGTLGGLSRFNGQNFQNFSTEDGLLNNRITALFSHEDKLWIGHLGGISLYQNGRFKSWSLEAKNKNISISKILFYKNKLIVSSNGNGLYLFENNTLKNIDLGSEDANRIRDLEVYNGKLFLATRDGLILSENLQVFKKLNSSLNLTGISKYEQQIIVTTTDGDFYEYKEQQKEFDLKIKLEEELYIYSTFIDRKGGIWSTTNSGLIYKEKKKKIIQIDEKIGLPFNALNCVYQDKNGTIWIGSDGKGLFRFGGSNFVYFDQKNNISSNLIISSVELNKNEYLFGSYDNGLISYKSGKFDNLSKEKSRIWTILKENPSAFWLGTDDGVIYYEKRKSKLILENQNEIGQKTTCFFRENNSKIFLGGVAGISVIENGKIKKLSENFNQSKVGTIRNILRFQNKLICAADGGLFEFVDGKFNYYLNHKTTVFSLVLDKNNLLWIGGETGLMCSDGKKINKVFLSDQPASNFVNFLNYNDDKVFVGTNNGLYLLSNLQKNGSFSKTRFGIEDGLINLETNINSSLVDSKGNLWFGTAEGLVCFLLKKYEKNINLQNNPNINIIKIKLNFQEINYKQYAISFAKNGVPSSLKLPPNKNNLLIELDGVLLKNYPSLKYQYWLEGLDESWVPAFSSPLISLSNLPAGKFKLHIRAKNDADFYSLIKIIQIEVKPYFYKTWWFISVMVLLIGILVYSAFKFRINLEKDKRYKESLEFKNKLVSLEQQSINASMNRHFIFNSLNSIQYFINTQDKYAANKYLTNFAKLIRKNLDSSSENNNTIFLNEEIERLDLYLSLEAMRFKDRFEYKINTNNIDLESIEVPAMLFQPFVENSIIHGVLPNESSKGFISITLSILMENNMSKLCVSIEDNGVGIDHSLDKKKDFEGDHKSQGMEITQKRISLLNKLSRQDFELEGPFQMYDENRLIKGTKVLIKIPIKIW
jgi:ligand-binding sensor domain-containing protein/two-component sensor histidine kinase